MSDQEAKKLLAAVKKASERTHAARKEMFDAAAERSDLVREAIAAGIPRDQIADAAGVNRTMIYRIAATR